MLAARRAWGHKADLGDQLDQPALLWDKDRLAMAGPCVPHQATSALSCMCVNLVKSVSQTPGKGGCLLPPLCMQLMPAGSVILGFLQTTGDVVGMQLVGGGLSAGACGLLRQMCTASGGAGMGRSKCRLHQDLSWGLGGPGFWSVSLYPCLRCVRISYGSISASESANGNPCPARLGRKYREGVQRRSVPRDTLPRHGRQLSLSHFL